MLNLVLTATILLVAHSKFLQLFRIDAEIDDNCWILNTTNLTEIGMGNCQDQVYFLRLGLGTPSQLYNFQIDTFRDLMWFPLNDTLQNISNTFQISNKKSVTYMNKNFVEGTVGSDIVSIPQTTISTRSLIVWANQNLVFTTQYIDGLLGMGYSRTPNFLDNAASSNQINSSIFSLQLGGKGKQSILYYNQLPETLEQVTIYNPVIGSQFWEIAVPNVKVGNFDFSYIASKRIIIDTSTSILYLNPLFFKKLFNKFFNDCTMDNNYKPICSCNLNRPNITFVLQNTEIIVDPESYTRYEDGQCVLLFGQTVQDESPMVMGSTMMKHYIVTFDKQNAQIGFNGKSKSMWMQLFTILQFTLISFAFIALGIGIYVLFYVRLVKKSNKAKQSAKQKLLQLSTQYIQP